MASNLTPLDTSKTVRHPGQRGLEVWEAFSADGQYAYIRFEDEGTTWQVKYLPTGFLFPDFFGSLGAARKWTASDDAKARVLALTAPVESAGFHKVSGLSILKSTGMSIADAPSGEEVTQRIMTTDYPIAMADAARAVQQFVDDMRTLATAQGETQESVSALVYRLGTLTTGAGMMADTVRRAAEYQTQQIKDRLAGDTEQDCDYCGPGRPCRCEADSTDPIENIYD